MHSNKDNVSLKGADQVMPAYIHFKPIRVLPCGKLEIDANLDRVPHHTMCTCMQRKSFDDPQMNDYL